MRGATCEEKEWRKSKRNVVSTHVSSLERIIKMPKSNKRRALVTFVCQTLLLLLIATMNVRIRFCNGKNPALIPFPSLAVVREYWNKMAARNKEEAKARKKNPHGQQRKAPTTYNTRTTSSQSTSTSTSTDDIPSTESLRKNSPAHILSALAALGVTPEQYENDDDMQGMMSSLWDMGALLLCSLPLCDEKETAVDFLWKTMESWADSSINCAAEKKKLEQKPKRHAKSKPKQPSRQQSEEVRKLDTLRNILIITAKRWLCKYLPSSHPLAGSPSNNGGANYNATSPPIQVAGHALRPIAEAIITSAVDRILFVNGTPRLMSKVLKKVMGLCPTLLRKGKKKVSGNVVDTAAVLLLPTMEYSEKVLTDVITQPHQPGTIDGALRAALRFSAKAVYPRLDSFLRIALHVDRSPFKSATSTTTSTTGKATSPTPIDGNGQRVALPTSLELQYQQLLPSPLPTAFAVGGTEALQSPPSPPSPLPIRSLGLSPFSPFDGSISAPRSALSSSGLLASSVSGSGPAVDFGALYHAKLRVGLEELTRLVDKVEIPVEMKRIKLALTQSFATHLSDRVQFLHLALVDNLPPTFPPHTNGVDLGVDKVGVETFVDVVETWWSQTLAWMEASREHCLPWVYQACYAVGARVSELQLLISTLRSARRSGMGMGMGSAGCSALRSALRSEFENLRSATRDASRVVSQVVSSLELQLQRQQGRASPQVTTVAPMVVASPADAPLHAQARSPATSPTARTATDAPSSPPSQASASPRVVGAKTSRPHTFPNVEPESKRSKPLYSPLTTTSRSSPASESPPPLPSPASESPPPSSSASLPSERPSPASESPPPPSSISLLSPAFQSPPPSPVPASTSLSASFRPGLWDTLWDDDSAGNTSYTSLFSLFLPVRLTLEQSAAVDDAISASAALADPDAVVCAAAANNGKSTSKFRRSDFTRLNDGVWANDEIVNGAIYGFLRALRRHHQAKGNTSKVAYLSERVWFVSSQAWSLTSRRLAKAGPKDPFKPGRMAKAIDMDKLETIVIPVNNANHWFTVVVDYRENNIRCYDSLVNPNTKEHAKEAHALNVMSQISGWLSVERRHWEADMETEKARQNGSSVPEHVPEPIWTTRIEEAPMQSNMDDCGIFAFVSTVAVFTGLRLTTSGWSSETITKFRRSMAAYILLDSTLPAVAPVVPTSPLASHLAPPLRRSSRSTARSTSKP